MPSIISATQTVAIQGRQILDAAMVANELIDAIRKHGFPWIILKLDLEKAFDNINWEFLEFLLRRMGLWCDPDQLDSKIYLYSSFLCARQW
ncbi:unnamed protein product [Linum trigynum]|uniref:Reverse transcriptase domain-containing protein n=1 Tax=Linum trigynum TaxID=586398 RepID=A0AAV2D1G9_9ROSI